jgi:hypothetical protein
MPSDNPFKDSADYSPEFDGDGDAALPAADCESQVLQAGDDTDDDVCPVCGQEYAHKSKQSDYRLREDAVACESFRLKYPRNVQDIYVHFPDD